MMTLRGNTQTSLVPLHDGDEMNALAPESYEAVAECREILSTNVNFCSGQDSRPMIAIKQDGMTGVYILTYGRVVVSKETFFDCCCTVEDWNMDYILGKMLHIRKVHKWVGIEKEEVEKIIIEQEKIKEIIIKIKQEIIKIKLIRQIKASNDKYYNDLRRRLKELKNSLIDSSNYDQVASDRLLYSGHGLFSMLLKNNFEYKCKNNKSPDGKDVIITRGVLLSGILDKTALGRSSGSLSHHIYKDYGCDEASNFVSFLLFFINCWLTRRGYSIGLEDFMPDSYVVFEESLQKGYLEAIAVSRMEDDPEFREGKLQNVLNNITTVGEKIARKSLKPTNSMVMMVESGSKGNVFNITSITSGVGQQNVEGKRIPRNFGGRSLPHYPRKNNVIDDWLDSKMTDLENMALEFQSGGLITSAFTNGLQAEEFFFLSSGGREGLIETAIKVARTGYISRKLGKFMEDLQTDYAGTVRNARDNIIQFCYGEDGMDPREMIKTKNGLACCDVDHIIDRLNADYEWDNKK